MARFTNTMGNPYAPVLSTDSTSPVDIADPVQAEQGGPVPVRDTSTRKS